MIYAGVSRRRERAMAALEAVGLGKRRALALVAFLPTAPDPGAVRRNVRQAVADHLLKNLSTASRQEVLEFCAEEKLFAPPLVDQDTLAAIADYIVEACEEWKWM